MTRSVQFYENLYNEAINETNEAKNMMSGSVQIGGMGGLFAQVLRNTIAALPVQIIPQYVAATAVLEKYCEDSSAHHKAEAQAIEVMSSLLSLKPDVRLMRVQQDKNAMGIFLMATATLLNLDLENEETKLDSVQKKNLVTRMLAEVEQCSPDFQKRVLQTIMTAVLKKCDFTSHKSDFASLCYTLVTKMNLKLDTELMKKIIEGANFSAGIFHCGSDQTRRAQALAKLNYVQMDAEARHDDTPRQTI